MDGEDNRLSMKMTELQLTLDSQAKALAAATQTLKLLAKETQKSEKKKGRSVKSATSEKKTSPFDKTVDISGELSDFLGIDRGQKVSRQFVSSSINSYVKAHGIQDPTNGRIILTSGTPEAEALGAILKPDQPLTFFNMQRYLKPHYIVKGVEEDTCVADNDTSVTKAHDVLMDTGDSVVLTESEGVVQTSTSAKKKIRKK